MKADMITGVPRGFLTIYSQANKPDLDEFFQVMSSVEGAPHFYLSKTQELCYRGQGNFGLLMYRKPVLDFDLFVRFRVPEKAKRANSGIFLRVPDINQPVESYPPDIRDRINMDLERWADGHLSVAPCTPAVHTSYEIQLEYGYEDYPEWRRNGCLYDIPPGSTCSDQRMKPFRLTLGKVYEVLASVNGASYSVGMREAGNDAYTQTVSFINVDAYRGANRGYVALQSYDTNEKDDVCFEFLDVAVKENDAVLSGATY